MCHQPLLLASHVHVSKKPKIPQNNMNFNCGLFSTICIICVLTWVCLTRQNSNPITYNNISKYELYAKQTNILPNNILKRYKRQTSMETFPKKASWDLLGSMKSPSLYTKFVIDGKSFNLEVDTGSFLTWFRCDYKSYQVTKII